MFEPFGATEFEKQSGTRRRIRVAWIIVIVLAVTLVVITMA